MRSTSNRAVRASLAGVALAVASSLQSGAAAQDIGFRGPSLAGSGPSVGNPSVTESKPQSKLWFNDGSWWGSLWSASALEFRIHRLDWSTHAWIDSGVAVEARPDSHCDALWDGTKLYLASHEFSTGGGSPGDPLLVLRYSYSTATHAYSLDAGFPVTIGDTSCEALTIDKDSAGVLWAVWMQDALVHFAHTLGSDTSWSTPAILPGSLSAATSDDLCSVVHFGNQIGVLWSDQVQSQFLFSAHVDGTPDTAWSLVEQALPGESDDHIHLEADSSGRVFAAVKNVLGEIKLVVRDGTGWHPFLIAAAADGWTRAIVLLDEVSRKLHAFGTVGPTAAGGVIFQKSSSLDSIDFGAGQGTMILRDGSGLVINNSTSTKQNLSPTTGLVLLAANVSTAGNYWHHEVAPLVVGNGLTLSVPAWQAGEEQVLTVTGATPRGVVGFYVGMRLGASLITRPQCSVGVPIELAAPCRRIGTATANLAGVATLRVTAPVTTLGKLFHFQVVEPVSCRASNRVDEEL